MVRINNPIKNFEITGHIPGNYRRKAAEEGREPTLSEKLTDWLPLKVRTTGGTMERMLRRNLAAAARNTGNNPGGGRPPQTAAARQTAAPEQGTSERYDLKRFTNAQAPVINKVRGELKNGHKQSHWMWYVFPQIRGLGTSPTAHRYGIASLDEARAYLAHPVLGKRLRECAQLMADVKGRTATQILGQVDAMKFHSSMTLFALASRDNQVFLDCLQKYFSGKYDQATFAMLQSANPSVGNTHVSNIQEGSSR